MKCPLNSCQIFIYRSDSTRSSQAYLQRHVWIAYIKVGTAATNGNDATTTTTRRGCCYWTARARRRPTIHNILILILRCTLRHLCIINITNTNTLLITTHAHEQPCIHNMPSFLIHRTMHLHTHDHSLIYHPSAVCTLVALTHISIPEYHRRRKNPFLVSFTHTRSLLYLYRFPILHHLMNIRCFITK